jgi:hypothetical protein
MRSYRDEPYALKWQRRTGFLRVALEANADVVFVAAVGCNEARSLAEGERSDREALRRNCLRCPGTA